MLQAALPTRPALSSIEQKDAWWEYRTTPYCRNRTEHQVSSIPLCTLNVQVLCRRLYSSTVTWLYCTVPLWRWFSWCSHRGCVSIQWNVRSDSFVSHTMRCCREQSFEKALSLHIKGSSAATWCIFYVVTSFAVGWSYPLCVFCPPGSHPLFLRLVCLFSAWLRVWAGWTCCWGKNVCAHAKLHVLLFLYLLYIRVV